MTQNAQRQFDVVSQDSTERRKSEEKLVRTLAENVEFSKHDPDVYCEKVAALLTELRDFRSQTDAYVDAEWKVERETALWRFLLLFDRERYAPQFADAELFFADLHYKSERYASSEREYAEATSVYRELFVIKPSEYVERLFGATQGLVDVCCRACRFRDAERLAREMLANCDKLDSSTRADYEPKARAALQDVFKKEARQALVSSNPNRKRLEVEARGLKRQARAELRQGRVFAAERYYKRAVETLREALATSRSTSARDALARSLAALGRLRCDERLGKLDEAEQNLEEATDIWRELEEIGEETCGEKIGENGAVNHEVKAKSADFITALAALAYLHELSKRWNVAESEYLETIACARAAQKDKPDRFSAPDKLKTFAQLEATSLFRLASVYARIGRAELAIVRYQEALDKELELCKSSSDAYLADVASTRFNLANLYKLAQRWDDAEREYEEAQRLYRRLNEEQPEKYGKALASTLNNLAALRSSSKRPADVKDSEVCPDYEESLKIFGAPEALTSAEDKAALATALQNSAGLRRSRGDFVGAEDEYLRSLAIWRELARENPDAYEDDAAQALNNLARLYCSQKDDPQKIAKAEPLALEALAIYRRRNAAGGRSRRPEIARVLYELGEFYRNAREFQKASERYCDAELNLRETLASRKSNADELRLELFRVLRKLGRTRLELSRNDEALAAFKGALEQFDALQTEPSKRFQAKRADVLDALAESYKFAGSTEEELQARRDSAEAYARLAQDEPEKKRGERASSFFNLAFACQRCGQFEESEKYYDRALELQRVLASDADVERRLAVANTLNNLSIVRQQTGQIELAVQAGDEATSIYRELERAFPGRFKSSIAQTLNNLSILYRAQKRFDDAEKAALEALEIRRLELERSPHKKERRARVASLCFNLANIYRDENRDEEAKDFCARASDVYKELAATNEKYRQAYEKTALLASQI